MRNDRGSQRAYDYNTLTQMVEMTNGPQMALMNAHNYVQFALGTTSVFR
jgi:hypothetical protein